MACIWLNCAGCKKKLPHDVLPGHLAVTVGESRRRFIIRAEYLNHPVFQQLLDQAYEEYGHNKEGPLALQCNEFLFQDIIHSLRGDTNMGLKTATAWDCKKMNVILQHR